MHETLSCPEGWTGIQAVRTSLRSGEVAVSSVESMSPADIAGIQVSVFGVGFLLEQGPRLRSHLVNSA